MKKIVSMLMVMLMTLSLCSTAFAAISPSEIRFAYVANVSQEGLSDDESLYVNQSFITENSCTKEEYEASKELINNQESVIEVLEENGIDVPSNAEMVLLTAGEYEAYLQSYNGEVWNTEQYEGPITLTLSFKEIPELEVEDGMTVFVLHYTDNGVWEVFECVVENYRITIDLDSLSPILIYKMMSDGTINTIEPDLTDTVEETVETVEVTTTESESSVSTVSTVKKSPYTGA